MLMFDALYEPARGWRDDERRYSLRHMPRGDTYATREARLRERG